MAGRVSVLAAEVRTALGDDLETTWHALQAGRSGIRPIAGFDASGFASSDVAQVFAEGVAPEDDPALRILGAHGRLLERVTARAHDAGGATEVERSRVGLYVALGMVDAVVDDLVAAARASRDERGTFDLTRFFGGGYRQIHPLWPLSMLNNVAIGQLSIDYDVRGDNLVLASESDGGVRALLEGAFAVIDRRIDAALVGGVAEPLMPASLARAALRGTLGRGAAPGEGAAAVVLGPAGSPARATFAGGTTTFGAERGCPGASRGGLRACVRRRPGLGRGLYDRGGCRVPPRRWACGGRGRRTRRRRGCVRQSSPRVRRDQGSARPHGPRRPGYRPRPCRARIGNAAAPPECARPVDARTPA